MRPPNKTPLTPKMGCCPSPLEESNYLATTRGVPSRASTPTAPLRFRASPDAPRGRPGRPLLCCPTVHFFFFPCSPLLASFPLVRLTVAAAASDMFAFSRALAVTARQAPAGAVLGRRAASSSSSSSPRLPFEKPVRLEGLCCWVLKGGGGGACAACVAGCRVCCGATPGRDHRAGWLTARRRGLADGNVLEVFCVPYSPLLFYHFDLFSGGDIVVSPVCHSLSLFGLLLVASCSTPLSWTGHGKRLRRRTSTRTEGIFCFPAPAHWLVELVLCHPCLLFRLVFWCVCGTALVTADVTGTDPAPRVAPLRLTRVECVALSRFLPSLSLPSPPFAGLKCTPTSSSLGWSPLSPPALATTPSMVNRAALTRCPGCERQPTSYGGEWWHLGCH